MESILKSAGSKMILEVTLSSTTTNRDEAARLATMLHGLRPGQVEVVFTNPSTEGDR